MFQYGQLKIKDWFKDVRVNSLGASLRPPQTRKYCCRNVLAAACFPTCFPVWAQRNICCGNIFPSEKKNCIGFFQKHFVYAKKCFSWETKNVSDLYLFIFSETFCFGNKCFPVCAPRKRCWLDSKAATGNRARKASGTHGSTNVCFQWNVSWFARQGKIVPARSYTQETLPPATRLKAIWTGVAEVSEWSHNRKRKGSLCLAIAVKPSREKN